jgi:hypothetical protein
VVRIILQRALLRCTSVVINVIDAKSVGMNSSLFIKVSQTSVFQCIGRYVLSAGIVGF